MPRLTHFYIAEILSAMLHVSLNKDAFVFVFNLILRYRNESNLFHVLHIQCLSYAKPDQFFHFCSQKLNAAFQRLKIIYSHSRS